MMTWADIIKNFFWDQQFLSWTQISQSSTSINTSVPEMKDTFPSFDVWCKDLNLQLYGFLYFAADLFPEALYKWGRIQIIAPICAR